jgi:EAL domain-containing protein (putative c-di-GMP-specific phosphodiesterase class I)
VAVNLSPRQLHHPDLAETVARVLAETGISPQRLELEFTEPALLAEPKRVGQLLRAIKAMGVQLALDDFGSGFSSLSLLGSLPIDRFKIDHVFVHDLATPQGAALVRAIIAFARHLDRRVIAEGVETGEQLAFLREHGCDEVQGYYCGRPAPAAEFDRLAKRLQGRGVGPAGSAP